MHFFSSILLLVAVITLTFTPQVNTTPIEGLRVLSRDEALPHPLVPWEFKGELGGHQVHLNGTIEQMYAQMQEIHRDFDLQAHLNNGKARYAAEFAGNSTDLETRAEASKSNHLCCTNISWGWTYAHTNYIVIGINYLKSKNICDIGPRSCVQISCSWNSAIISCNDNTYKIEPKCNYIATYAGDLVHNECTWDRSSKTCGQFFDTDRYNVIVRRPVTSC